MKKALSLILSVLLALGVFSLPCFVASADEYNGFVYEVSDGCVTITRIQCTKSEALMHVVNSVGDSIDETGAKSIIKAMADGAMISRRDAALMNAAMNENCYRAVEKPDRGRIRAEIFKRMIISCLREEQI